MFCQMVMKSKNVGLGVSGITWNHQTSFNERQHVCETDHDHQRVRLPSHIRHTAGNRCCAAPRALCLPANNQSIGGLQQTQLKGPLTTSLGAAPIMLSAAKLSASVQVRAPNQHFYNSVHQLLQSMLAPQVRGFAASARTLRMRIRSVGNIRRITKTMKMVAASKLKGFEMRMRASRPLSAAIAKVQEVMPKSDVPVEGPTLCVTLNSDKGLCGAVNSTIIKSLRNWSKDHPEAQKNIVMIGDKGRAPMSRLFAKDITLQFTDHAKKPPSFVVASLIAEEVSNSPQGEAMLFYNKFKSAIAYETTVSPLPSKTAVMASLEKVTETYEFEGDEKETLADMYQFMLASRLFNGLLESTTCEFSARMQAMDGASKNCGQLINRLTTQMNRARQASITTELCEIIAGAESLKG